MTVPDPLPGGVREAAQLAQDALLAGRREDCALILYRHAYAFIRTRLMHGAPRRNAPGLSYEDAEDQIYPLIDRFTRSKPDGRANGLSWLISVIDSQLIDAHRRRLAKKRGGDAHIGSMHDDEGNLTPEAEAAQQPLWPGASAAANLGLDDCMERATADFEADRPTYARLLRLLRQGLEGDEIVAHYADDPDRITDKDRNNFKSRKSTALKLAREYFEPCKEMTHD